MPRSIPSELFDYDPIRRQFSAEASTLQGYPGGNKLSIVSKKTGEIAFFECCKTDYFGSGEDREVGGWHYRYCGTRRWLEDITVWIIND